MTKMTSLKNTMNMITTIKPYGSVNVSEVNYLVQTRNGFFIKDRYGYWKVDEHTFIQLKRQGLKEL